MSVELNHTIVWSAKPATAARFVADILGRSAPVRFGHFHVVSLDNAVGLDFARSDGPIQSQHYAFLISENDFDAVLRRIQAQGIAHWADPMRRTPDRINRDDGGRGVYFSGPDDHLLEVITRPYGA